LDAAGTAIRLDDHTLDVTPRSHDVDMDSYTIKRHLDDVETQLRRAKRAAASGSDVERYIKRALSALDDAQRLVK
jgi:hypothetical protein